MLGEDVDSGRVIGAVGHIHGLYLGHEAQEEASNPLLDLGESANTQTWQFRRFHTCCCWVLVPKNDEDRNRWRSEGIVGGTHIVKHKKGLRSNHSN